MKESVLNLCYDMLKCEIFISYKKSLNAETVLGAVCSCTFKKNVRQV